MLPLTDASCYDHSRYVTFAATSVGGLGLCGVGTALVRTIDDKKGVQSCLDADFKAAYGFLFRFALTSASLTMLGTVLQSIAPDFVAHISLAKRDFNDERFDANFQQNDDKSATCTGP